VQDWRESGELPFPNMSRAHREGLEGTLDYPPRGSPGAKSQQPDKDESLEPLSVKREADDADTGAGANEEKR
jgi:hypothetical protein